MKFLVPLAFAVAGVGAGVGAGVALRPSVADAHGEAEAHAATEAPAHGEAGSHGGGDSHASSGARGGAASSHGGERSRTAEYIDLGNQFIIPILSHSDVDSFVVLDVDLEVTLGTAEAIHRLEPKIRDAFLTVLFDHANAGGFDGTFTSSGAMDILRAALREAGQKAAGDDLSDVLITSIVRQDV